MRRSRTFSRLVPALALLVLGFVLWGAGAAPIQAASGVPLPTEAGSVWRVLAGYNTATHFGEDPHAIDIVREDAPTAGSLVLAPVAGQITFVSGECATVRDAFAMNHLLCHFWPEPSLERGVQVQQGKFLGTVAPDGFAGNNGIAHVHYAIHHALGGGFIGLSVPFMGQYALEGLDLPWTGEFNTHAGLQLVSSNGSGTLSATPTDKAEPAPPAVERETLSLLPGWNLVGWTATEAAADAVAQAVGSLSLLLDFDAASQQFRRFAPDLPGELSTLATLRAGQAVLVLVDGPQSVVWSRPMLEASAPIPLEPGFNLVTWTGPATDLSSQLDGNGPIVAVHAWDPLGQRYQTFRPGTPISLSGFSTVQPAQALWVETASAFTWVPPAFEVAEQAVAELVGQGDDGGSLAARVLGPGCLNLRSAPSTLNNVPLRCLTEGTPLELQGQRSTDDTGRVWIFVGAEGFQGWVAEEFVVTFVAGVTVAGSATYYHPSLAGNVMYCGGTYQPADVTIAATTSWPCGTRLRVSRGESFVDVTVQDTGLLPANHVDLSEAAFSQLGLLPEGRISVLIEVLNGAG